MSKKFSFIIISYNEKEYLVQAVESCLAQKLPSFEIVIGDDGSSDGSLELIESYAGKYPGVIRYFVSERTGVTAGNVIASLRVSAVIRRALEMAEGSYCAVLSGDDYFYENGFLKDAVQFLDRYPEYAAYTGGYEKVWPDQPAERFYSDYEPKLYWAGKYIHLTAFVFRKAVFEQGAFLQRFCDDAGLVYSLAVSGKWKYDPRMVFAYRQRSSSIMHTADQMEFRLSELMILQDVLCKGKLYTQSMAHYAKSLRYVFHNREKLGEARYQKYIENCKQYEHNVIGQICEFDRGGLGKKMVIYRKLAYADAAEFLYRIRFKLKEIRA